MMCCGVAAAYSQAKKPTLMVVPSEAWCTQNGYTMYFDNQGTMQQVPDYDKALASDPNLLLAISKIGELMSDRGFPLKDLSSSLRTMKNEAAEESVTTSKSGDSVAESPLDKLKKVAKADIWIVLTYSENRQGPKKSITFNMQGIDTYTDKQVAAASGTGELRMGVEVPVMLADAAISYMPRFSEQLQAHFDDLFANGREISLICRRWSGSEFDFESEFGDDELGFLIEGWVEENTQEGRFSVSTATENRMVFEQVRIPMLNDRGRGLDARTWARGLQKWLKDTYSIESKVGVEGLGKAIITVGEK